MKEAKLLVEKRVYPRISAKLLVKYEILEDQKKIQTLHERKNFEKSTNTVDLSLGGAFVLLDERLALGSVLRLNIKFSEDNLSVSVYADVTWANETGCGIRFWAMKDADMVILKSYLAKISVNS
jgi:c-di-GMP-binding flagellar brake protein YcgR